MQKTIIKFLLLFSWIFFRMLNLDIIYDVTIAVTWDEINTYKWVIYQPTRLPSFVTFDGICFSLRPRTLSFGGNGRKNPSNGPPWLDLPELNPFTPKSDLIDFTLSNARRFYSSKGDLLGVKGLTRRGPVKGLVCCKHALGEQALNQPHTESRVIRLSSSPCLAQDYVMSFLFQFCG